MLHYKETYTLNANFTFGAKESVVIYMLKFWIDAKWSEAGRDNGGKFRDVNGAIFRQSWRLTFMNEVDKSELLFSFI